MRQIPDCTEKRNLRAAVERYERISRRIEHLKEADEITYAVTLESDLTDARSDLQRHRCYLIDHMVGEGYAPRIVARLVECYMETCRIAWLREQANE